MPSIAHLLVPAPALLLAAAAHAQSQLAWSHTQFLGDTSAPVTAVALAPSANVVIVGEYRWFPGTNTSALLQIRTANGDPVGGVLYPPGATGSARWYGVAVDAAGAIALAGNSGTAGLIGLADPLGAFVFPPVVLPAPFGRANAVAFDPNGNLLAAGRTLGVFSDVYVVRYSPAGVLLGSQVWAHAAGGEDEAFDIAVGAQGDVYLTGRADLMSVARVFVLRLDATLGVLWARERFGTASASALPAVALDAQGNPVVACGTSVPGQGQTFTLWKLDAAGTTQWERYLFDAAHPSGLARQVAVDPFGSLVVAGSWSTGSAAEALVASYDAAGNLRWSRPVASSPSGSFYESLAVDAGGDVLVGGWFGPSALRAHVRRYDRDGNERWSVLDDPLYTSQGGRLGAVVAPDGRAIAAFGCSATAGPRAVRVLAFDAAWFPVCAGDGALAACPCANESPAHQRSGCLHSLGSGGHLDGSGFASLASDTLTLLGSSMPNSSALYFQATALDAPALLGDGLRCAGGTLVRLGLRANSGGASQLPGPGNPPLSTTGGVAAPSTRWYQAWFRNAASFCTSETYNVTNALRVTWMP